MNTNEISAAKALIDLALAEDLGERGDVIDERERIRTRVWDRIKLVFSDVYNDKDVPQR